MCNYPFSWLFLIHSQQKTAIIIAENTKRRPSSPGECLCLSTENHTDLLSVCSSQWLTGKQVTVYVSRLGPSLKEKVPKVHSQGDITGSSHDSKLITTTPTIWKTRFNTFLRKLMEARKSENYYLFYHTIKITKRKKNYSIKSRH